MHSQGRNSAAAASYLRSRQAETVLADSCPDRVHHRILYRRLYIPDTSLRAARKDLEP